MSITAVSKTQEYPSMFPAFANLQKNTWQFCAHVMKDDKDRSDDAILHTIFGIFFHYNPHAAKVLNVKAAFADHFGLACEEVVFVNRYDHAQDIDDQKLFQDVKGQQCWQCNKTMWVNKGNAFLIKGQLTGSVMKNKKASISLVESALTSRPSASECTANTASKVHDLASIVGGYFSEDINFNPLEKSTREGVESNIYVLEDPAKK